MDKKKRLRIRLAWYLLLTAGLLIIMLFGEQLSPHDPYENNLLKIDQPPGAEYWFGTDNLGRCLFSRILTGARSSLSATLIIVLVTAVIGTTAGVTAGYYGGPLDAVIQKLLLIVQSFPGQVMAIAVAGVLGAGVKNAAIALISIGWISYARMSRSMVLKIKESNYIKAARLCGCNSGYIILRHVIPNIGSVLFVTAMLALPGTMMEISSLSFLGLSAKLPTPEWGYMMNEGRKVLMTAPWQTLIPGGAILISVIILNRLGDSVQEYLEYRTGSI